MKSKILSMIILAIVLGSCATQKKKLEKFQNFALNNPGELAKLCADKFPVKEITKPGRVDTVPGKTVYLPGKTIYLKGDSVKCPDQTVQCPPSTNKTDTVFREDTAKLKMWMDNFQKERDSLNLVKGQLSEVKDQLKSSEIQNRTKLWTIVALIGIIGAGVFLKIKGII